MENIFTNCEEVLLTKEQIQDRVKELARQINEDYDGEEISIIGVLRGSFIFMADLVKLITRPVRLDFIIAKSYVGTETSGEVRIIKDVNIPVAGKNVLLVEDIVDSGFTLSKVVPFFEGKNTKSVKICTLLDKPSRRVVKDLKIDYLGFQIPDAFVVGYGLDYNDYYRNFSEIRIYNPYGGTN